MTPSNVRRSQDRGDAVRPVAPGRAPPERVGPVGIAADHGGFALKAELTRRLRDAGFAARDFGANEESPDDDYPDLIAPLARAVASGDPRRGIAICGSGVGACVVANKIVGIRAALCADTFSAHQGVEDDDMNVLCIGARVTGPALAWEIVQAFLAAHFRGDARFRRRLEKISALEGPAPNPAACARR
jgi:ribose 5-phosphate isomerase B